MIYDSTCGTDRSSFEMICDFINRCGFIIQFNSLFKFAANHDQKDLAQSIQEPVELHPLSRLEARGSLYP